MSSLHLALSREAENVFRLCWASNDFEKEAAMAKIVMPLGQDFDDKEFKLSFRRCRDAGHEIVVLGTQIGDALRGKNDKISALVQSTPEEADPSEFAALVIAGGYSPDNLRTAPEIVAFVRKFAELKRPIAAICHGPRSSLKLSW